MSFKYSTLIRQSIKVIQGQGHFHDGHYLVMILPTISIKHSHKSMYVCVWVSVCTHLCLSACMNIFLPSFCPPVCSLSALSLALSFSFSLSFHLSLLCVFVLSWCTSGLVESSFLGAKLQRWLIYTYWIYAFLEFCAHPVWFRILWGAKLARGVICTH